MVYIKLFFLIKFVLLEVEVKLKTLPKPSIFLEKWLGLYLASASAIERKRTDFGYFWTIWTISKKAWNVEKWGNYKAKLRIWQGRETNHVRIRRLTSDEGRKREQMNYKTRRKK